VRIIRNPQIQNTTTWKIQCYWLLKLVVHIVTTAFYRVNGLRNTVMKSKGQTPEDRQTEKQIGVCDLTKQNAELWYKWKLYGLPQSSVSIQLLPLKLIQLFYFRHDSCKNFLIALIFRQERYQRIKGTEFHFSRDHSLSSSRIATAICSHSLVYCFSRK
jgi:hypothetical protein